MSFENALTVTIKKAYHPKLFVLQAPLAFESDMIRVEVPAGFETDLASIPWWGRWVFTRAHSNAYAAVIHDYCYERGHVSRRQADNLFFEALADPVCNTNWASRWVMWAAVRAGGWRGWRRARKLDRHFSVIELFGKRNGFSREGAFMKFNLYMGFQKPRRRVNTVFVHCSASDIPEHDNAATIDEWHRNDRNFNCIGYHYFIRKDGTIECGRNLEKTPAAQRPFNRGSIAICCHGLKEQNFTEAQFNALRTLCHDIDNAYGGEMRFRGHCEVSPKTCPVFDYKAVLRLDKNGRLMTGVPTVKKLDAAGSQTIKEAKKVKNAGDIATAVGVAIAAKGGASSAQDTAPLETVKELTAKGLEYKTILMSARDLAGWALTSDGLITIMGAGLVIGGLYLWRRSNRQAETRVKDEPKIERLKAKALEVAEGAGVAHGA